MKTRWVFAGIATLLVIAAVLVARRDATSSAIDLGGLFPLTGDAAQWGIPPRNGALLAIEELNAAGGVNAKKLALLAEDDQALPREGVSAFNKLVSVNKVPFIIGSVASNVTLAVAPLAEKEHVALISPASTSPKITQAGDYVFRVVPSDALRGEVFAEYLFKDIGARRVAFLYINNEGGVGGRDAFSAKFRALGGTIVLEEAYKQGATDLRAQLTKIKASDAKAVIVVSYPQDTVVLMQQARELALGKPLYFQTEAVEDGNVLREAGDAAEGAVYIITAPAGGDATKRFAEAYRKKYSKAPELFAAEAYDIVYLIAAALKANANTRLTGSVVRDYLYKVSGYPGASGTITFDKNGDVVKPMAIKRIEHGQPVTVRTW